MFHLLVDLQSRQSAGRQSVMQAGRVESLGQSPLLVVTGKQVSKSAGLPAFSAIVFYDLNRLSSLTKNSR